MTNWTIDKKAGVATCPAWDGVLTASKTAPGGKWFVRWESDAREIVRDDDGVETPGPGPALTIDAHVHYLDRFGIDAIPASPDHALDVLAAAASFNGPTAIRQHLESDYPDRVDLAGEAPSAFLGPDPF